MSGFVYKWVDSSNNKFYIGSHKGTIDDGYIGSGVLFNRAFALRPENFSRSILYEGEDYLELEDFILKELDAENNKQMYNLKSSAIGGKTQITDEGRKRLSESKKGAKNPNFGTPTWNKGLKRKPHVIEAIRKAQTGRVKSKEDKLKVSKYICYLPNYKEPLLISEVAKILGYKDCSTLRDFAKDGKNKRLKKLNLKINKL